MTNIIKKCDSEFYNVHYIHFSTSCSIGYIAKPDLYRKQTIFFKNSDLRILALRHSVLSGRYAISKRFESSGSLNSVVTINITIDITIFTLRSDKNDFFIGNFKTTIPLPR